MKQLLPTWSVALLAGLLARCGGTDTTPTDDTGIGDNDGDAAVGAGGVGAAGKGGGGTTGGTTGAGGRVGTGGTIADGSSDTPDAPTGGGGAIGDDAPGSRVLKMGIVTDIHEGRTNTIPGFLSDAIAQMKPWRPDVLAALGDLVDSSSEPAYATYAADFFGRYTIGSVPRAVLPGNHDFRGLDLPGFLDDVPLDVTSHYVPSAAYGSFDLRGVHVVTLDGEYGADGTHNASDDPYPKYVSQGEIDWLAADLAKTSLPSIILTHEALAGPVQNSGDRLANSSAVEQVLRDSRKVFAAVSGHTHADEYAQVAGIHYFTLNSLFDLAYSPGYTTHDKGCHGQLTIDLDARSFTFEFWENDSVKGYLLAHTQTGSFP